MSANNCAMLVFRLRILSETTASVIWERQLYAGADFGFGSRAGIRMA